MTRGPSAWQRGPVWWSCRASAARQRRVWCGRPAQISSWRRVTRRVATFGGKLRIVALIPGMRDAIGVPALATSGIADGSGMGAALMLGTAGLWGTETAFFASTEAKVHETYRTRVTTAVETDTDWHADLYDGHWLKAPPRTLKTPPRSPRHEAGCPAVRLQAGATTGVFLGEGQTAPTSFARVLYATASSAGVSTNCRRGVVKVSPWLKYHPGCGHRGRNMG